MTITKNHGSSTPAFASIRAECSQFAALATDLSLVLKA
jgi:hypothetical protein